MTEKKEHGSGGKTRREFLKDAGLLVGGTAIGSTILLAACGGGETETVTNTVTDTVTSTAPGGTETVTSTTTVGAGQTATETETQTQTQTASKFIDPIDGTEFDTLAELQAHFTAAHPMADESIAGFNVNGVDYAFKVKPYWSLSRVLREGLGMFALKEGCMLGECGACTVIVDGMAVLSCLMLACEMDNRSVVTVEGLSNNGVLNPVQQRFYDTEAPQCGYCTPGIIMAAQSLIDENPTPTLDEVRLALSGHLCMCGALHPQVKALEGGV